MRRFRIDFDYRFSGLIGDLSIDDVIVNRESSSTSKIIEKAGFDSTANTSAKIIRRWF
jgi:hypothetical protein